MCRSPFGSVFCKIRHFGAIFIAFCRTLMQTMANLRRNAIRQADELTQFVRDSLIFGHSYDGFWNALAANTDTHFVPPMLKHFLMGLKNTPFCGLLFIALGATAISVNTLAFSVCAICRNMFCLKNRSSDD